MENRPSYELHPAETQAQKDEIYRFRFDVFGREMGLLGPLENWKEPSFSDLADTHSYHFFAEFDDEVVGSVRITSGDFCATSDEFAETYELQPFLTELAPKEIAVVTRLMVSSEYRGSVLGLHLVKETADYCLDNEVECVFIDCQPHLVPLYQRYGFRSYRTIFNDPYVGVMVPLVLVISDFDHLMQVRSPFLRMIKKKRKPNPERIAIINSFISHVPSIVTEELQGDEFFHDAVNKHLLDTDGESEEDWSVLEGLSADDISTLSHGSYMMQCTKGDTIIQKNHATKTMFLVIDGLLECQVDGKPMAFVSKGDVVGEFAYLTNAPRTADIVVVSDEASVLAFEKKHMLRLIESHPRLAARCLLNLSRSLCVKFINHSYPGLLTDTVSK
ncbi:MAG: GNAT family N-acetyltransferase [Gammaproteobacteria bacterium]|nr:GNAT family N-acetyltransferase [Gammaproteobacteria bacterium]